MHIAHQPLEYAEKLGYKKLAVDLTSQENGILTRTIA
jgi:hypothetical protein